MNDNYDDSNKKFDFEVWKEIYKYTKNCRKAMVFMLLSAMLLAISDALLPLLTGYGIDKFIVGKSSDGFITFAIAFLLVAIFFSISVYSFIRLAGVVESTIQEDIRSAGFRKLQELSFSYYDETPVGWIVARMGSDVHRLGRMIAWGIIDFVWGTFSILLIITFMMMLNIKLATIIILLMPIISVIGYVFQVKILKGHRETKKVNSKITASFSEGIAGAKTTKTLVREDGNMEEFYNITDDMKFKSIRVHILSSIFLPLVTFIGAIGTAFVLTYGSYEVQAGAISIGTLSVFLTYSTKIFQPIQQIAKIFSEMLSAQASGERIFSLINQENEVVDSEEVKEKYGDFFNKKEEAFEELEGDVEFKDVTFKYKNGETVLNKFNLKVNKGEKIALIGSTGSGKSTIINLICRFYEPTEGEILIDGVNYKNRSQNWLHSNLSYVLQTPHLFAGTIKENIKYGKLDATDEEVIEATKKVNAYDFIMNFEKGFDTKVGEGGNRLSQGEKQLISFARAIIGSPKLFVLDEATSSIDTITEKNIQGAIDNALDGITSFIVAHRLSTIRDADRILVINKGEILEDGSHETLIKNKSHYYDLYMKQFKEEEYTKLVGDKKEGLI